MSIASADLDDGRADRRSTPSASGLGVCNACESLLVHADVADDVPAAHRHGTGRAAASRFAADERPASLVPAAKPATDEDYAAEFLGPIISVKVVESLDEAIEHINRYGSQAHRRDRHQRPGRGPRSSRPASIARR